MAFSWLIDGGDPNYLIIGEFGVEMALEIHAALDSGEGMLDPIKCLFIHGATFSFAIILEGPTHIPSSSPYHIHLDNKSAR